ncbi:hypothetical protein VQL36_13355 [Chengkuizengella sp. SCS-71B]|uniref:hypothetical protein n=1 Tax=Chengkuizengella sp. SCS-71B TaxID=3115290 RepID=UPI0032C21C77
MSGHNGSAAGIVLVLFILLVIILLASIRTYNRNRNLQSMDVICRGVCIIQ